jgi:Ulp1 family protease
MSENGVVPSNEPWVPRWKHAENTALRERKLSEKDADKSLRRERVLSEKDADTSSRRERLLSEGDPDTSSRRERLRQDDKQLSESELRAKLWRQSDGNHFRKPSEKERKLSGKLEGVWSELTAADVDDHAPMSSEEDSSVPTEAYDEACFHVDM